MRIVVVSDTHLPRFQARMEAALRCVAAQRPSLILRMWVVNPGSPTDRRRQPRYSFALLERAANGTLDARLIFFG